MANRSNTMEVIQHLQNMSAARRRMDAAMRDVVLVAFLLTVSVMLWLIIFNPMLTVLWVISFGLYVIAQVRFWRAYRHSEAVIKAAQQAHDNWTAVANCEQ